MAKGLKGVVKDQTGGNVPALRPVRKAKPKKPHYVETKRGLRPSAGYKQTSRGLRPKAPVRPARPKPAPTRAKAPRTERQQRQAEKKLIGLALGTHKLQGTNIRPVTKRERATFKAAADQAMAKQEKRDKIVHLVTAPAKAIAKDAALAAAGPITIPARLQEGAKQIFKAADSRPVRKATGAASKAAKGGAEGLLRNVPTPRVKVSGPSVGQVALPVPNASGKIREKKKVVKVRVRKSTPKEAKRQVRKASHAVNVAAKAAAKGTFELSDQLSRGAYAGSAATKAALQGKNPIEGAKRGATLKEKTSYVDIVGKTLGLNKLPGGKAAALAIGSAGDIGLDPANLIGVGEATASAKVIRSLKAARTAEALAAASKLEAVGRAKQAEKAAKAAGFTEKTAKQAGKSAAKMSPEKYARKQAKKAYKEADEALNTRDLSGRQVAPLKVKSGKVRSFRVPKAGRLEFDIHKPSRKYMRQRVKLAKRGESAGPQLTAAEQRFNSQLEKRIRQNRREGIAERGDTTKSGRRIRTEIDYKATPEGATRAQAEGTANAIRRMHGRREHESTHVERALKEIERDMHAEYGTKTKVGKKGINVTHADEEARKRFVDDIEDFKLSEDDVAKIEKATGEKRAVGARATDDDLKALDKGSVVKARKLLSTYGYQKEQRGIEGMLEPGRLTSDEAKMFVKDGAPKQRPNETTADWLDRADAHALETDNHELAAEVARYKHRADQEAQHYFPRKTHEDLREKKLHEYEPPNVRTKAPSVGRREVRKPLRGAIEDQIESGHLPTETYIHDDPIKVMRDHLDSSVAGIHVHDMWKEVHATGRKFKPGSPRRSVATDGFYVMTPQGLKELNGVSEATLFAKQGKDVRILPKQLVRVTKEKMQPSGWVPDSAGGRAYLKAKSGMTHVMTTISPSSWGRNVVGDTSNALLGGSGVRAQLRGWGATAGMAARHSRGEDQKLFGSKTLGKVKGKAATGSDRRIEVVGKNGQKTTRKVKTLTTEAQREGITGGIVGGELRGTFGKRGRIARAASGREAGPRLGSFIEHRRTMDLGEAAKRTNKYHFDYQDLTKLEKGMRDAFFPFLTFTARNARLQTGELLRHTTAYNSVLRTLDQRARDAGYENVGQYLSKLDPKEAMRLPIPLSHGLGISMDLPVSTLMQLYKGGVKEIPGNVLDMAESLLTPMGKIPIELLTNHSFYTGEPLVKKEAGVEVKKSPAPSWAKSLPKFMQNAFGVEDGYDSDGKPATLWSGIPNYLLRATPQTAGILGQTLPESSRAVQTKGQKALGAITGIRLVNSDQKRVARTQERKLGDQQRTVDAEIKHIDTDLGGKYGKAANRRKQLWKQSKDLERQRNQIRQQLGDRPVGAPRPAPEGLSTGGGKTTLPGGITINAPAPATKSGGGLPPGITTGQAPAPKNKPSLAAQQVRAAKKVSRQQPVTGTPVAFSSSTASRATGPSAPPVSVSPTRARKASGTYIASTFGGGNDPGTGHIGYRGDDLNKKWNTWAELGKNGQIGNALGGLPYGTPIRVTTDSGRSMVLYKRDIGKGGAGEDGHIRGVDIWHTAAEKLKISGLAKIKVEVLGKNGEVTQTLNTTTGGSTPNIQSTANLQAALKQAAATGYNDTNALAQAIIADATASVEAPSGGGIKSVRSLIPNDYIGKVAKRGDIIDARQQPYLWGGGHLASARDLRKYKGPLDCSGAVSKMLGINPRVASQFKTIGKAGANYKRITIFAKDDHVLMYVPGKGFFGTSKSNPGGGAGWIPRSAVPPSYLSKFTARHL